MSWLDLARRGSCRVCLAEIILLFLEFYLGLPIFAVQSHHEVLEVAQHIAVLRQVAAINVTTLFIKTAHLEMGGEEPIDGFLLIGDSLHLLLYFVEFHLVARNAPLNFHQ